LETLSALLEGRAGSSGKGLDPREPRRMIARLTPKGKQVVSQLLETVPYPA